MHLGNKNKADTDAVPLHSAVLCMNCECVTGSSSEECLVCGSRSLFSLAKLLGGTQAPSIAKRRAKSAAVSLLAVEITIGVKQIEPAELSAVVEGITNLIVPTLVRGQASFHINVVPADSRDADGAIAA